MALPKKLILVPHPLNNRYAPIYQLFKACSTRIVAALLSPKASTKTDHTIDVQALLSNHTCLGCHAIDKKNGSLVS